MRVGGWGPGIAGQAHAREFCSVQQAVAMSIGAILSRGSANGMEAILFWWLRAAPLGVSPLINAAGNPWQIISLRIRMVPERMSQ